MKRFFWIALIFVAASPAAFADNYVLAGLGRFTLPQNNAHADNAAGTSASFTVGRAISSNFDVEVGYTAFMNSEFTAPGVYTIPASGSTPAQVRSTYNYIVSGHALGFSTIGHVRMCDSCGASLIGKLGITDTALSVATSPYFAPPIPLDSRKIGLAGGVGFQFETRSAVFRLMLNESDAGSPYRIKNVEFSLGSKF